MNTQNTPVHIRLWHRDFWLMAIANLLLTIAVYLLIPVMPKWLMQTENLTIQETGMIMGAFGVGIFLFGCFTSYLVQRFRRNMACIWAIMLMAAFLGWLLSKCGHKNKLLYTAYYFVFMNLNVFQGMAYLKSHSNSGAWEKAKRS